MKNQTEATAELAKSLADWQKKYEATHDDTVKLFGYAIDHIRYQAPLVVPAEDGKPSPTPPKPSTPAVKQSL